MKAIIFSAGMGTRISRHIGDKPKCLVEVFGAPLICYTIDLLKRNGFTQIAVVTGYCAEQVEEALPDDVRIYRNPFYAVSNSIASLWFARDFISGDQPIIAMNGDVFMEETILRKICRAKQDKTMAVMVADSSRIDDADYKLAWDNCHLRKFGKDLEPSETSGEYVGLGLIYPDSFREFVATVEDDVMTGDYTKWWEEALYVKALYGNNIGILDICGDFWVELDFVEDLNRLNQYVDRVKGGRADGKVSKPFDVVS